jgi:nicotinic acid mononucleotide adenylyltransferase
MKDYKQLIKELPSKSVVFAFGRFNPPTIGHELLVKAVKKLAQQRNADHVIYASRTQDAKKNPLSVEKKVKYLKLMFKNTNFAAANDQERTFIEAAKALNKKYKNIVMVAGSDRIPEFKRLLNNYNGKEFNFDTIEVVSAGERDPDADDATGMSASKMRSIAVKGNYAEFKKGLPSTVRDIDGKRLMNDIRDGMGLEPIKEQIVLVKDELREKYFRGEIFNEGDIVESAGERFTIVKRGSNHLLLKEESGNLVSKWIQDVQPTEEKEDMNEALTDKTLRPNDKIKVARIIATMLGVDNAETSSNPENLINQALRKVRTKALNPEALHILDKMLNLATEQGIQYDSTLKPSKLKEGAMQIGGTDKIETPTDSVVVNKKSNFNMAKDILRFNDFKKLQKVQEQHKGKESQADHNKDNESDVDADFDSHKTDKREVGHTLVSPGGQDNLRRRKVKYHLGEQKVETGMDIHNKIMKKGMSTYEKEGGHELTAQHISTDPEHSAKQKKLAQSFLSRMQGVAEEVKGGKDKEAMDIAKANLATKHAREKESLSHKHQREKEALKEEHIVHVDDGSNYGDKPHPKDVEHVNAGVKKHGGEFDGHSDKGAYFKFKSQSDAKNFADHVKKSPHKSVYADLHEEVQLEEATVKTQKYSWGTMKTVHHGADFSIPLHPEHHQAIAKLKDEQEHKFKTEDGKHWTARRKGDEVHFQGANNGGSTKVKHTDLKEETIEEKKVSEPTGKLKDACWKGYTAVGMKTKNGRKVPNCVPVNEEEIEEEVCPVCGKSPCECEKPNAGPVATDKPFDPFFKEDEDEFDFPEPSDDEIDSMADELSDDDYLDTYEEDELGIVDDETGEELEADEEEEKKLEESTLMEVLSRIERMKAKARIRRTKAKRERATKIALKRYSNTATINKRARRLAIKLMKKRLLRGRDPSKVSVGEKERIERTLEKRKAIIGRIATRLAPRVRKVEKARLSHTKYTQGSQPSVF